MNSTISKYLFYLPSTYLRGENVSRYLKFARQFQYWDRDDISAFQLDSLRKLVNFAYENSLFYRNLYDENSVHPNDLKELNDFKNFPTVSKQDIVEHFDNIRTKRAYSPLVTHKTTGGSTGRAVTIIKNARALAHERAVTWRSYEWAGVTIGSPQARFWGIPLSQFNQRKYRLIDLVTNRQRFSAFDISPDSFQKFYEKLHRFRPQYLYGYVSVILQFVNFLDENDLTLPDSVTSIITTSEILTETTRTRIGTVTGLKVYNEYGCGEVGSIAHECEQGNMHIMDESLYLEAQSKHHSSDSGSLLVSDFHNYAMPLIRYEVGDNAQLSNDQCSCGRTLSILKKIHGREYDTLYDSQFNPVHPEYVMYVFEEIKDTVGGIKQFQVLQHKDLSMEISLVKEENFLDQTERTLENKLKSKFGEGVKFNFRYVDTIRREASGKLRLVKSQVNT